MARRQKHFGFTGLYGIILLIPALLFFYGFNTKIFPTQGAVPLSMEMYKFREIDGKFDTKPLTFKDIKRQYKTFIVTDDVSNNDFQLKAAANCITEVATSNDTLTGARIVFGKGASYESLVKALNICMKTHGMHTWMLEGNELRVFSTSCEPDIPLPVFDAEPIDL